MSQELLTRGQLRTAALIAATAAPLMRALSGTLRWRVDGFQHYEAIVAGGRQPIFALWHGRILPATLFWQERGIVVLISQNFDGEWIARIIERFGFQTSRGSSSRGGARALVQLRRELAAGRPVGFTIDGPRGPAKVVQPGAAFLAGATGHPMMPIHMEATRAWEMGSWDRGLIPRPFARVAMAIGAPIVVPGTGEADVAAGCATLGAALAALEDRARSMMAAP